jgi:hypothetical protein
VSDEMLFPEDAIAQALRGFSVPLEPSANLSLASRELPDFIIFHIVSALFLEQEIFIAKDKKFVGKGENCIKYHEEVFNDPARPVPKTNPQEERIPNQDIQGTRDIIDKWPG